MCQVRIGRIQTKRLAYEYEGDKPALKAPKPSAESQKPGPADVHSADYTRDVTTEGKPGALWVKLKASLKRHGTRILRGS